MLLLLCVTRPQLLQSGNGHDQQELRTRNCPRHSKKPMRGTERRTVRFEADGLRPTLLPWRTSCARRCDADDYSVDSAQADSFRTERSPKGFEKVVISRLTIVHNVVYSNQLLYTISPRLYSRSESKITWSIPSDHRTHHPTGSNWFPTRLYALDSLPGSTNGGLLVFLVRKIARYGNLIRAIQSLPLVNSAKMTAFSCSLMSWRACIAARRRLVGTWETEYSSSPARYNLNARQTVSDWFRLARNCVTRLTSME